MNRKVTVYIAAILAAVLMAGMASAQTVNLKNSESFNNHNFAIIKWQVNGTVGTPNALSFATTEEPLMIIVSENETISISLKDWGVDSSRFGTKIGVRDGTDSEPTEYLMLLERIWGHQISQVRLENIMVQVGQMDMFRGRTAEWVKFCVVVSRIPAK